eukprot:GHVU01223245.1.p1 GENE.GHVU01223245.1~~GHVU01223245.1.p1  ORF type:complete len:113 (-),score=7.23 GHVU01223245.1:500-838(-)
MSPLLPTSVSVDPTLLHHQELVNLILTGRATSNVFDGEKLLGSDPETDIKLKSVGDFVAQLPVVVACCLPLIKTLLRPFMLYSSIVTGGCRYILTTTTTIIIIIMQSQCSYS